MHYLRFFILTIYILSIKDIQAQKVTLDTARYNINNSNSYNKVFSTSYYSHIYKFYFFEELSVIKHHTAVDYGLKKIYLHGLTLKARDKKDQFLNIVLNNYIKNPPFCYPKTINVNKIAPNNNITVKVCVIRTLNYKDCCFLADHSNNYDKNNGTLLGDEKMKLFYNNGYHIEC